MSSVCPLLPFLLVFPSTNLAPKPRINLRLGRGRRRLRRRRRRVVHLQLHVFQVPSRRDVKVRRREGRTPTTLKMDPIPYAHARTQSKLLPPSLPLPSANNKVAIIVGRGRRNAAIIGHEIFPARAVNGRREGEGAVSKYVVLTA